MPTLKILYPALLTLFLLTPTFAQKRAPRPKTAPKAAPAAPTVSFDNLLSADSYKVYVEIRNVGQLISSSSFNEILEPVLRLSAPPKEFKTGVKWLAAHADSVTSSRMMIALWPTAKDVPNVLVAIEFDTPEEAAKFEPQLNEVLRRVLPKATPTPSPQGAVPAANNPPTQTAAPASGPAQPPTEPGLDYYVKRSGSLVFVTSSPLTLKNLKPVNSKPLTEDQNFRTAYDRFTSESIFAFVNIKALEQQDKERSEAEQKRAEKEAEEQKSAETMPEEATGEEAAPEEPNIESSPDVFTTTEIQKTPTLPDPMAIAMGEVMGLFFGGFGETKWPEAIALAGNLDASFFDVRALLVTSQAEKPAAVPFFPALVSGPLLVPESPSILPADTELIVTMSLDLPQVYAALTKRRPQIPERGVVVEPATEVETTSPFAFIEKKLGMKLQESLIPLLGNEVVFSMPVSSNASPEPSATPTPSASTPSETTPAAATSGGPYEVRLTASPARGPSPTIALSLKDKEGMRAFLPKLIDALGFQGASALAQTERHADTEIVTYANALSYAFIGNFLVISPDAKNVKHVVDAYLKRETLSSDINFKNSTRWQPRQLQGQVYVSPALMESYKKWANEPNAVMSDQTKEFLSRLTFTSEPVTYSLSNEGTGPLHQLRIPKNLLLMAVAGMSSEINQPPMVANERSSIGTLYFILHTESTSRSENGSYLSLEELIAQKKIPKEMLDGNGYHIEVNIVGNGFEAVAVPIEYGKTGKMSFFINESGVLRGADHGGAPATIADNPVQ